MKIDYNKLLDFVQKNMEQSRILVVGDVMLDRYWYGPTSRISPEAPVPVVKVDNIEERPGGAANVAMNIASATGATAACRPRRRAITGPISTVTMC